MPPMIETIDAPPAAGPVRGSAALLPSLGQAVTEITGDDAEQRVGFRYVPEGCGATITGHHDPCREADDKPTPDNLPVVEAWPFVLVGGDRCSGFDLNGRDWQGRATRQLLASQSFQVAAELWAGAQAQAMATDVPTDDVPNRWLASEAADNLTEADGPTSPTDALARLEYGLGQCLHGGRGVIHATLHAVTFWQGLNLVRREGNQLLTVVDTIVIADAGYDGSGPNGEEAEDGSQWAYATGGVNVRLGPVRTIPSSAETARQGLDRSTNTVEVFAERPAAVAFEPCCHLAVELNLGEALIGGAS